MKIRFIKTFTIVLLITVGLVYSDTKDVNPKATPTNYSISPSNRGLYEVVSFFPFHFPMEVTFAPDYKPVVPSLGTEIIFNNSTRFSMQMQNAESPMNLHFDSGIGTEVDPILRDRSPRPFGLPSFSAYRSPGVVFLVTRNNFSIHFDLNFRMTLDLTGQAATNLLRTGFGVSYRIPSEYLAARQYSAKVDLSLQAIEFQPWEERRKNDRNISRQFYLSPGITIGSSKGWMVEGLIRMPLPGNIQEITESTYKPEVQGRLGLKWYLPEGKP